MIEKIYRASVEHTNGRGIVNAEGPDINGKIYANIQIDGTTRLLSVKYTG